MRSNETKETTGTDSVEAAQAEIKLTIEEQKRFLDLILEPTTLNAAMRRARQAHAAMVRQAD